jgi:methyl-accepting chemotaxis protein
MTAYFGPKHTGLLHITPLGRIGRSGDNIVSIQVFKDDAMRLTIFRSRGLLSLAFAAAILAFAVSGAVEYWGMMRLDRATSGVRRGDTALATAAEDMRENLLELRRYEKDVFMNVGAEELVREYRAKWDRAFTSLRYDLVRARRVGSTSQDAQLQRVVDRIADYHVAFAHIYDLILNGTIRTTQQANEAMGPSKDSVRNAESTLGEIGGDDRDPKSLLGPAVVAQRLGLAASFLSFLTLAVLFTHCLRRLPSVSYA